MEWKAELFAFPPVAKCASPPSATDLLLYMDAAAGGRTMNESSIVFLALAVSDSELPM